MVHLESFGPGITYRGTWTLNETYVSSSLRRDVVQGSNGEYYLVKSSHTYVMLIKDRLMVVHIQHIGMALGQTFSSVVTDILFSQDVYAQIEQ